MSVGATTKQVEISAGTTLVLQGRLAHDGSVWTRLEPAIVRDGKESGREKAGWGLHG